MKFLLPLIGFFLALVFFKLGLPVLINGSDPVIEVGASELQDRDGGSFGYVESRGYLVRLGSPEDHRFDSKYVYALVARDGSWEGAPTSVFDGDRIVLVKARGRDLPYSAFEREREGVLEHSAGFFTASGPLRRSGHDGFRKRFLSGTSGESKQVVLIDHGEPPHDRFWGAVAVVLGALCLWPGWRFFRNRRRKRLGLNGVGGEGEGDFDEHQAGSSQVKPTTVKPGLLDRMPGLDSFQEGCGALGAKFGLLAIPIFIALAKMGDDLAPIVDDVAEIAGRAGDDVPASSLRNGVSAAGDVAGDLAKDILGELPGQVSNIKTIWDAREKLGNPSRSLSLKAGLTDFEETYELMGISVYELKQTSSVSSMTHGSESTTELEEELPDRDRGEFLRIHLQLPAMIGPADFEDGPSTVQFEWAYPGEGGRLAYQRSEVEVELLEGSWYGVALNGDRESALGLTDKGKQMFSDALMECFEREFRASSESDGVRLGLAEFQATEFPNFRFELKGEQLRLIALGPIRMNLEVSIWM